MTAILPTSSTLPNASRGRKRPLPLARAQAVRTAATEPKVSNHTEEYTMQRRTADLTPHPENKKIYGESADAAFLQSVAAKGVLVPLVITYDNRIISGHRRWAAAQAVKLAAVPVSVFR